MSPLPAPRPISALYSALCLLGDHVMPHHPSDWEWLPPSLATDIRIEVGSLDPYTVASIRDALAACGTVGVFDAERADLASKIGELEAERDRLAANLDEVRGYLTESSRLTARHGQRVLALEADLAAMTAERDAARAELDAARDELDAERAAQRARPTRDPGTPAAQRVTARLAVETLLRNADGDRSALSDGMGEVYASHCLIPAGDWATIIDEAKANHARHLAALDADDPSRPPAPAPLRLTEEEAAALTAIEAAGGEIHTDRMGDHGAALQGLAERGAVVYARGMTVRITPTGTAALAAHAT